ncbi:hypothetical protein [Cribrihabitans neustonicus]|uniref:hypothetical protein n=1 Tax=Cribrihabitans neustonicus TaxID=1429085 RepID=UPI003B5A9663
MQSRSFDQRLARMGWQPGPVPSREIIENLIGRAQARPGARTACSAVISLAGAVSGLVIGVGLKGMVLPDSPWGPGTGLAGAVGGGLALAGLALSLVLALYAGLRSRRRPKLMQFASMNLLMIVVLLLS